mgnify:FL=1
MYANGGIPGWGADIRIRNWRCRKCEKQREEWLDSPPFDWNIVAVLVLLVAGFILLFWFNSYAIQHGW